MTSKLRRGGTRPSGSVRAQHQLTISFPVIWFQRRGIAENDGLILASQHRQMDSREGASVGQPLVPLEHTLYLLSCPQTRLASEAGLSNFLRGFVFHKWSHLMIRPNASSKVQTSPARRGRIWLTSNFGKSYPKHAPPIGRRTSSTSILVSMSRRSRISST